jgi:hypothetical protein
MSNKADKCPKCGAPAKKRTSLFTWLVVVFILALVFEKSCSSYSSDSRAARVASNSDAGSSSATIKSAPSRIAKKDGTFDARENDLDEICQDWVRAKAKAYKYGREGNQEAAAEARKDLADTNRWLSAYPDADVSRVCAIYDTSENLSKWMR